YAFDFSVWELWGALAFGGRVVVVPWAVSRTPEAFRELLLREGVTVLNQTPSAFSQLVGLTETAEDLSSLRLVIFGGEALEPRLLRPWLDRYGDERPRLVNMYGITETTVHVTERRVVQSDLGSGSRIGRPLAGWAVYLLSGMEPVPAGTAGEIFVGGAGVAQGYLGRPDLTAARFVPDPFGGEPGARLYRSGDLARHRPDGDLEYLGRIDHQVKVRGFRIELGEIEAALLAIEGVREAAVLMGEGRLVAYVVTGRAAAELRRSLQERLPDYMVPSAFVALAALPLTPNGKVDRKALPAPERQGSPSFPETGFAPRTPVEEILAGIWAEVLGVDRVEVNDHFFELGGHSLLATQVASRLRSALGVEVPVRDLFSAPKLADLAFQIEAALRAGAGRAAPPLVPVPRDRPLPLSFAQQRLWFLDRLEPGGALYNMSGALRIEGPLDRAALALCLGEIVRRHEALRTVFAVSEGGDGSPVQVIEPAAPLALPVVDLSGLYPTDRTDQSDVTARLLAEEAVRPFDLAHGPLVRCLLLRLAENAYTLALTLHHIVSDGWSLGILVREVAALYPA